MDYIQSECNTILRKLKCTVCHSGKRFLTFEINNQITHFPPTLKADLSRIVFVSHLQSQDCVQSPDKFFLNKNQTKQNTQNGQLGDHEEKFTEFDKKVYWMRITDSVMNYNMSDWCEHIPFSYFQLTHVTYN